MLVTQMCTTVSSAAVFGEGRLLGRVRGEHGPLVHQIQRGGQVLSRHGVRRRPAGPFGGDDRGCAIDPLLHERRPELADLGVGCGGRHTGESNGEVGSQGFEEGVDTVAPCLGGIDGVVVGATLERGVSLGQ